MSKPLILSEHFQTKWAARFGAPPGVTEIERIIHRGAWLQRGQQMAYPDGRPWRSMAIYVDFGRGIAVKIDEVGYPAYRKAVTFVSEGDRA